MDDVWVFAYGSLIWNPGFAVAERRLARLDGYHRSFCMRSTRYRGTPDRMGLVLALDRAEGATCHGLALRANPGQGAEVQAYLRDRELTGSGYEEQTLTVQTDQGSVQALAYVIDPTRPDYCRLPPTTQASLIAKAHGQRGSNRAYLYATAEHLADLGIPDAEMDHLVTLVRALAGPDRA